MEVDGGAMKLLVEAMKLVELLMLLLGEGHTILRSAWTPAPVAF